MICSMVCWQVCCDVLCNLSCYNLQGHVCLSYAAGKARLGLSSVEVQREFMLCAAAVLTVAPCCLLLQGKLQGSAIKTGTAQDCHFAL